MDDVLAIHYDLEIMQEILDTVNHVAKKYHVVFGIKKCEVIRDGKGPPSNLKLEKELETILNETLKYKYLGEMLNNKGNMEDHIKYIKGKIQGATQKIISTTGNKEFNGIQMEAIWLLLESTIITDTF